MDLKEITIEKIALFIVVLFVTWIFIDYSFDLTNQLKSEYEINKLTRLKNTISDKTIKDKIDLKLEKFIEPTVSYNRKEVIRIFMLSLFPLLFFTGKVSFQKTRAQNTNDDSLTVTATVFPLILFVGSFYLLKIEFINQYHILILTIMLLQLLLLLSLDSKVDSLLANVTKIFSKK